jgi:hypothetical protein
MALSDPRVFFGVHAFTPYSRTTGEFYGTTKVIKGSTLTMEGELQELMGGSSKFPWAVEDGAIKAEMSLKFSEYPDFLFTLFLGKAPTANAAETTGAIAVALANVTGTSAKAATTGIASVGVKAGSHADLKFGHYIVKVVSATTVDVYYGGDIDIARGTNGTMVNDLLKVTAAALTITTGGVATAIPNFGLELIGGSGAIAMTIGDTASFQVRPPNTASTTVRVGSSADQSFPEFGAIVHAQKRGNSEIVELDVFRCKAAGMPLGFEANAWSESEVKIKVFYDSTKDGVFDFTHIKPSST